ncbi:MAG: hypothetical protein OSJ24_01185 [Muribaculaceae bacterium]|nr:hypothetical protein [Muribaculaceae bacterium]
MNRLFFIISLLAFLMSCTGPHRRELTDIDNIIEETPDSALRLLMKIDATTMGESDYPLYALLLTQAQVKNDMLVTSDSLITIAVKSFDSSTENTYRLRSHFYAATVAFYAGNMPDAMKHILAADEMADALGDPYWRAKTSEITADIYEAAYNYPKTEKLREEAAGLYLKSGKIRNHRFALCDLAITKANQNDFTGARAMLDSLRAVALAENPIDSALANYALRAALLPLTDIGDEDALKEYMAAYQPSANDSLYITLINSHIETNNPERSPRQTLLSDAYNIAADEKELIQVLYADYCYALQSGDYKDAAIKCDSLLLLQSKIARELINESVDAARSEYFAEKATLEHSKLRQLRVTALQAVTILLLIIALIIVATHLRLKAKRAETEAFLIDLQRFKELSAENEKRVELLFKGRTALFNRLCAEYFAFGNSPQAHKRIIAGIDKELSKLRSPKTLAAIEESVNNYRGDIMAKIRKHSPNIKDNDFTLLSLTLAGYSAKTIAFLLAENDNNIYQRKNRIVAIIANSTIPDKEIILHKLDNSTRQM